MMPYGTAAEAEAALGRSLTWAEAWWFWYSARMPDFWLMWHIALVYFVMYAIVPLPLLLLQQLAPAITLKYKLQPRVKLPSPIAILQYMRDNTLLALFIIGPFPPSTLLHSKVCILLIYLLNLLNPAGIAN
jgi:hypothetical protein